MNKYEQLIEHIINDETDKARDLFHNIVVEKSRDIYESLIDEEDLNEVHDENQVDDLVDEVTQDEEGLSEEEEGEEDFGGEDDSDMDFDGNGEIDAHEEEHGDVEDRVQDLEAALDELKAEFDALMAGEEQEPEHADMFGGEEEAGEEFGGEEEEASPEAFYEGEECDSEEEEEDDEEEELDETLIREYVELAGVPYKGELNPGEGKEVGKAGSVNVNKTTPVAGKNDMGGSAKNLAQGGAEKAPDGTTANKGAANAYKKGEGKVKGADNFENVPGAKAGQAFAKKETSWEKNKKPEGQTTSGKLPVADKSILKQR